MAVRITGGERLKAHLNRIKTAAKLRQVRVGFFADARYPDGTQVSAVAAWNEFGTRKPDGRTHIPERPFFRQSLELAQEGVVDLIAKRARGGLEGGTEDLLLNEIGSQVAGIIQKRIADFDDPGNAEFTIERKGTDNPLVDDGVMRTAVTWRVSQ